MGCNFHWSLIKLSKSIIKKYKVKKCNILGHSDIAYNRKKDPGEKFPWKLFSRYNIGIWHNLKKNRLINQRRAKLNNNEDKKFLKKVIAQSPSDLQYISACCSEAKTKIKDIKYLPKNKLFLISIQRLNKEQADDKTRINSIVKFEYVDSSKSKNINQKNIRTYYYKSAQKKW